MIEDDRLGSYWDQTEFLKLHCIHCVLSIFQIFMHFLDLNLSFKIFCVFHVSVSRNVLFVHFIGNC